MSDGEKKANKINDFINLPLSRSFLVEWMRAFIDTSFLIYAKAFGVIPFVTFPFLYSYGSIYSINVWKSWREGRRSKGKSSEESLKFVCLWVFNLWLESFENWFVGGKRALRRLETVLHVIMVKTKDTRAFAFKQQMTFSKHLESVSALNHSKTILCKSDWPFPKRPQQNCKTELHPRKP